MIVNEKATNKLCVLYNCLVKSLNYFKFNQE